MDVILTQDVKALGKKGELVAVNEGYARNYLIPKGLATIATKGVIAQLNEKKEAEKKAEARALKKALDLANTLKGSTVTIEVKAGEKGKIFGSITANDVATAINKQFDLKIDKKKVQLETIKELGTFDVKLKLYPEVSTIIKVNVKAQA